MTSGTFTAAGQTSDEFTLPQLSADISLTFAAAGEVVVERNVADSWKQAGVAYTESIEDILYAGSPQTRYRLKCNSAAGNIDYGIET